MSFDTLAPHYRWLERILAGEKLQRCRTTYLDQVPAPRNILLLGEGHGRGLRECRNRFQNTPITCLDSSRQMLVQARRSLAGKGRGPVRVEFVQADALNWTPTGAPYDLIITNFFLDCFRADQLERIISRFAGASASDANWLLADFQAAPAGWRRVRSRLILWAMYRFFRTVTRLPARELTPPDIFLERAGFTLRRRTESEWGLLRSDWWRRRRPA